MRAQVMAQLCVWRGCVLAVCGCMKCVCGCSICELLWDGDNIGVYQCVCGTGMLETKVVVVCCVP